MKALKCYTIFFLTFLSFCSLTAQCEIFKSEIIEVKEYMLQVSKLTDSLRPASEMAAFDAQLSVARKNAKEVALLTGQAVTAAEEAVTVVAEAQYNSQNCKQSAVASYTIDAENHAIDARDFADEAFENAKSALAAKNLGNLQFHMRKVQRMMNDSQTSADAAVYAAEMAHYDCEHAGR